MGVAVAAIFLPFMLWRSAIERPGLLALGLVATAAIGFAIAQVLPRELEGTIAILGVIGLE